MGFVGGLGLNLPISSDGFISIQPELLYIQKGIKYKDDNIEIKSYSNYLELPLLLKVNFGSEAVKAYVNGGPSFAYLLNGKLKSGDKDVKVKYGDKNDLLSDPITLNKDDYNRFDIGLQFGGGIGVQAGPGVLGLDVRYGLGLTNYLNDEDASDSENKSKNRVIQLALQYAIPLGSK